MAQRILSALAFNSFVSDTCQLPLRKPDGLRYLSIHSFLILDPTIWALHEPRHGPFNSFVSDTRMKARKTDNMNKPSFNSFVSDTCRQGKALPQLLYVFQFIRF